MLNILKLNNKAANAVSVKEIFICERSRHEKQTKSNDLKGDKILDVPSSCRIFENEGLL